MQQSLLAESARKHGVDDEDILHAVRNYLDLFALDEGMTMVIGPARDGGLLEVGLVDSIEGQVIVHAVKARSKFLR